MKRKCFTLSILASFLLIGIMLPGCNSDPDVQALIAELSSDEPDDRLDAIKELENIGKRSAPAAEALGRCLSDEGSEIRYRAAKALAKLGRASKVAIEPMSKLLIDDPDTRVHYYVAKAIDDIADQEPAAVTGIVSNLVAALADKDPKTRYYLVKAIGKASDGSNGDLAALEKLSNDTDEAVRKAALTAVKRIKKKQLES